uniref:Uncharacterized protein n=1 Tax=Lepeophtheirus salmonis TaxID=72036 RepID=A0A0K2V472_LEPSM
MCLFLYSFVYKAYPILLLHKNSYCIKSSYTYIIERKNYVKKNIMENTMRNK